MVAVVMPEGRPVPAARPAARPALRPVTGRPRVPARTYRRRRMVAAGLALGVLVGLRAALGLVGGGLVGAGGALDADRPVVGDGAAGSVYLVQPGDTFWSIATRLDPRGDPRPLVDRMVAAHGTATLYAGERIVLPRR